MKKVIIFLFWLISANIATYGQSAADTARVKAQVDSLHKICNRVFYEELDYKKAINLIDENLNLIEGYFGKGLRYARSLNLKAMCLDELGDTDQSQKTWMECLEIRQRKLSPDDPACGDVFQNLGKSNMQIGRYREAESYLSKAKSIFEKNSKMESSIVQVLVSFGYLYTALGKYKESETSLIAALQYYEKGILNKDDGGYSYIRNNLGTLYWNLGNYPKAESNMLEARQLWEKELGGKHPLTIASISNLGALYDDWGQSEKAEVLMLEAIKLRRETLGPNHPDYANSLANLSAFYFYTNRVKKAKSLLLKSSRIIRKALGAEHPDYLLMISNLGSLYCALEKNKIAKRYMQEAITRTEKMTGTGSPDLLSRLSTMGFIHHMLHENQESDSLFRLAEQGQINYIADAVSWQSEQELAITSGMFQESFNRLSCAQLPLNSGALSQISFDYILFYKGFLFQAAEAVKKRALSNPETYQAWQNLAEIRRKLADEQSVPLAERDSVVIYQLEEQSNAIEKTLAEKVSGFGKDYELIEWKDVQVHLQQNEAALEFIRFNKNFPKLTDSTMYAALLLLPGEHQPQFIPLFEEKQWSENGDCKGFNPKECAALRYSFNGPSPLYSLIWQALDSHLTDIKTIYYSPVGLLHMLDMDAISIDKSGTALSDKYRLVRLGSTRQIAFREAEEVISGQSAVLFGGIRYEMDSTAIDQANSAYVEDTVQIHRGEEQDFELADSSVYHIRNWKFLPGSQAEIGRIQETLKSTGASVRVFTGFDATEAALKHIGNSGHPPRTLHLATHGFFYPDPKENRKGSDSGSAFISNSNPMLRSGLILAGANHAWKTGKALRKGMDDGILTAYEISQLNFEGTELVVLSACQTGQGDVFANEGIYGLQRAFKIAGVKYLIMSLQNVPDQATRELMGLFYTKWLVEKLPLPDAFHSAQSDMRRKYPNEPQYWAGWILVQ